MFSAIALNALGYKINSEEYKRGCSILAEKGGLSVDQALELNEKKLYCSLVYYFECCFWLAIIYGGE